MIACPSRCYLDALTGAALSTVAGRTGSNGGGLFLDLDRT